MLYLIVDGDDIGRKITSYFITNDEARLTRISTDMTTAVGAISVVLQESGFRVFFCAADGVVAANPNQVDAEKLFERVRSLAPEGITFSAGTGETLQQAYVALMQAKCSGKNRHLDYGSLNSAKK
jgi:hypothetical protein